MALTLFQLPDPVDVAVRLFTGLVTHFLSGASSDISRLLDRYLFTTVDPSSPGQRPLTANPRLRSLSGGLMIAADTIMTAIFVIACLRSMFDHAMRSHYQIKAILPRMLLAVCLIHGSLFMTQMLIDLNNALGHVALTLGDDVSSANLPWSAVLSFPSLNRLQISQDLFHCVFDVALVVALVILVLSYVIRIALLNVLVVTAPLAALCTVLPDTRGYARTWMRLFLTTVFMQAVQLIVLRVATVTAVDHDGGIAQSIYGIATLYIVLKVPGALGTASHLETKAKTMSHSLERSLKRAIDHGRTVHRAAA